MDLNLMGSKAIVTGASQGIGRAIAKALSREGVEVLAVGRNPQLLESLRQEVEHAHDTKISVLVQDLLAEQAPKIIAREAVLRFGHVDILINNAGRSQPLGIFGDDSKWSTSMLLEFEVPRQLTEALLPQFLERRQGVILNVISSYELKSLNASAVAKAALATWSKQLSAGIGEHGVRINCLQPGLIDTENIRRFFSDDQRKEFAGREIALMDFGAAEDMANMAAFLVSTKARYVTGSVVTVDGGLNRYPF